MFQTFSHVHLGSHLACKGQRARANTNPNPNQALAGLGSGTNNPSMLSGLNGKKKKPLNPNPEVVRGMNHGNVHGADAVRHHWNTWGKREGRVAYLRRVAIPTSRRRRAGTTATTYP